MVHSVSYLCCSCCALQSNMLLLTLGGGGDGGRDSVVLKAHFVALISQGEFVFLCLEKHSMKGLLSGANSSNFVLPKFHTRPCEDPYIVAPVP